MFVRSFIIAHAISHRFCSWMIDINLILSVDIKTIKMYSLNNSIICKVVFPVAKLLDLLNKHLLFAIDLESTPCSSYIFRKKNEKMPYL